jgi:D-aspartate ligase
MMDLTGAVSTGSAALCSTGSGPGPERRRMRGRRMLAPGVSIVKGARHRVPLNAPRGAVILGGDYLGLGIARSLGRQGIPVYVVDDEHTITRFSRFTTCAVHASDLHDEKKTRDMLLDLGRELGLHGWVLFPTRDEIVSAVAKYRSELLEIYRVPLPDWQTVEHACDKRSTYALAHRLGIPAPRTWYPGSVSDIHRIDADPPFAVKPAIKEHFFYATKAKAWRADTRAELEQLYRQACQIAPANEIMIQELIPGDGGSQYAFCAFFKDGRSIGSMVARRRRQHPADFGRATTFAQTLELPTLVERSERLLRAIDYYGLVELEYKHDARDGEYKLLDFNARAWGYHSLGAGAGVDFPLLLFDDQDGRPVEPRRARPDVSWVRLTTDLPTVVAQMLGRRLRPDEVLRTFVGGVDVEAVFSRDDPIPGIAEAALLPYTIIKRGY